MIINNLSETAITISVSDEISLNAHHKVMSMYSYIKSKDLRWINDLVPAYTSLSVFVDFDFYTSYSSLKDYFFKLLENYLVSSQSVSEKKLIELEVNYNGEDLESVAEACDLSVMEVIEKHSTPVYTVAMIGFTPGFPYLLGLDTQLHLPRRATPRLKVPSRSVAIGGQQTGIYPKESPGGWHLIGSISVDLFDSGLDKPNYLEVGDQIKFISKI